MVKLDHQEDYCLAEVFQSCPVFQGNGKVLLAKEKQEPDEQKQFLTRMWITRSLIALALILSVTLIFLNWGSILSWLQPDDRSTNLEATYIAPTYLSNQTSHESYQPGFLPISNPTPIPSKTEPSPVPVVEITPNNPGDEIYIGHGILLHKVVKGDTLDMLAEKYYTLPESILDINYGMTPPIILDKMIVIPEGMIETQNLPTFEIKFVKDKTKVLSFVKKYKCDLAQFKKYNRQFIITSVETDYILGENWVVIPRERAKKTD